MEETNDETFSAQIAVPKTASDGASSSAGSSSSSSSSLAFLRTGDLGFLHNSELYVSGRLKDLIIVRGRNYYPQDIEATVEACSDELRPGCVGCFVVTGDDVKDDRAGGGGGGGGGKGENVGVLAEVRDSKKVAAAAGGTGGTEELIESIRSQVMADHGLALRYVVLLEPRTVPKTTSGKIARAWCKRRFLGTEGSLEIIKNGRRDFGEGRGGGEGEEGEGEVVEEGWGGEGGEGGEGGGEKGEVRPSSPSSTSSSVGGGGGGVDPATIRSMPEPQIMEKLTTHISQIANLPKASINQAAPLTTVMDSMSVSQLKGLLESSYAVTLSDEYLFREDTTVEKLVDVVKLGYAPDDSQPPPGSGDGAVAPEGHERMTRQPPPGKGPALAPPGLCCAVS